MSGSIQPTKAFWVVSWLAFVWNLIGVGLYVASTQVAPEAYLADYGPAYVDIVSNKPIWATAAFAIGVFAGLLGCVGLLLRKAWASHLFILSILAIIIHNLWIVMSGAFALSLMFEKIMAVIVLSVAVLLIWYARKNVSEGVLI